MAAGILTDEGPIGPVSYVDILHAVEREVSHPHARAWPRVVTVAVDIHKSGRTYPTLIHIRGRPR